MLGKSLLISFVALGASSLSSNAEEPKPKESRFDSDGVSIRYFVRGSGVPIVFLHGATSSIDEFPKGFFRDYEHNGMMAIAMELRGHGESGKPHDKRRYGQEMVKDVVRLLDHLNIKKAHISGGSLGANVGLNVATRYPNRVLSLTMFGAGRMEPRFVCALKEAAKSLADGKGVQPLVKYMIPGKLPPAVIGKISHEILEGEDKDALVALISAAHELVLPDEIIKVNRVPTLVIIGDEDPFRTGVKGLKRVKPDTEVLILKNADHRSGLSPEATKKAIAFLKANTVE